ncbi:DNA adenine methylase [Ureaplasma canigenitalium]|uniref:DNA adenine methylase n=1 Tax=Ureaplasma canigenitalium TaxID=42092 RepID=UPI00068E362A|nr:DNA adenine methylase [Ureaplasma canigenitalium]
MKKLCHIYIYISRYNLQKGNTGDRELNKRNYNILKDDYNALSNKDSFEGKIMLLLLVIYGFNSQIRFNSKNEFNIPIGKQDLNPCRLLHLKKFVNTLKGRNISFTSNDFRYLYSLVESGTIKQDDFLYFDPPYLITNASYNANWSTNDEKDLYLLLDFLNEKGFRWALSNVFQSKGLKNELLISFSEKYKVHHLNISYKNSNYQRKSKETDDEVFITNYEN